MQQNILLFAGSLKTGGTEKHYYQLAKHLDRNAFKVHILLYENDFCNFGPIPGDVTIHISPSKYGEAAAALDKIVRKNNISLIYSCAFETSMPVLLNRIIFFNYRYKFITGVRGFFSFPLHRKIVEWLISACSQRILINSSKAKEYIPALFRKKSFLIYNGIDFNAKDAGNGNNIEIPWDKMKVKIIGCVARLCKDKGIDLLIQAFKLLHEKHPDYRLILVGDGEEKEKLMSMCCELGIENLVHFAGNSSSPESYIKQFDIFVLPSRTESFPNVLLETIMYRVPYAAADVGGVSELTKQVDAGLTFPKEDVEQMAKAIEHVVKNKSDYTFRGHEYFSLSSMIKKFESQFTQ